MIQAKSGDTKMAKTSLQKEKLPTVSIDGFQLTLEELQSVAIGRAEVLLSNKAIIQLENSRRVVERLLGSGKPIYGITTGFGKFKDVFIRPEDTRLLQRNFMRSHAAGVGDPFPVEVVRAAMLLRANALAKGFSGIRSEVVKLLVDMLSCQVHPFVPSQGSVGASGDLAPLAHIGLVLMGEGRASVKEGSFISGEAALSQAGLEPVVLEAKEGLALTNGTQFMAAMGALLTFRAERLAKTADLIGALTVEAQLGSPKAFSKRVHELRPHPGQIASAANLRKLLEDSAIVLSHKDCGRVQDAYSLRCMPQVHGASRQAISHARQIFSIEINAATDNPLVFDDEIISGGNFHGQPLALALDYLSIALAELANISERRLERLVNPALSQGLPAFLCQNGGLESGFMIAQYTAAALVSENKVLSHPASVDSIPTSANQEDHVSMGTIAGRKAMTICTNLERVLAIELLCAAQGLDFRMKGVGFDQTCDCHYPLNPGPGLHEVHKLIRKTIPFLDTDREIHKDIDAATHLIQSGDLVTCVENVLGPLS